MIPRIFCLLAFWSWSVCGARAEVAAGPGSGEFDESNKSAIDRPDFKIRNLPYSPESAGSAAAASAGGDLSLEHQASPSSAGIQAPNSDAVLSAVPNEAIVRYLDQTDFDKRLSERELAEKYLGPPAEASSDSHTLAWLMTPEQEQRAAKIKWFQAAKSSLSMDEISRYIDLRPYRVTTTLKSIPTAALRKVEAPGLTIKEIEKLKMPEIKPLTSWDQPPLSHLEAPPLRPIGEEGAVTPSMEPNAEMNVELPVVPEPEAAARPQPAGDVLPPRSFGIPTGLRNGP